MIVLVLARGGHEEMTINQTLRTKVTTLYECDGCSTGFSREEDFLSLLLDIPHPNFLGDGRGAVCVANSSATRLYCIVLSGASKIYSNCFWYLTFWNCAVTLQVAVATRSGQLGGYLSFLTV